MDNEKSANAEAANDAGQAQPNTADRHEAPARTEPLNILLLTNRDSDNTGDQVIEECDKGLIRVAMDNLGFTEDDYEIQSSAAGIISKKYLASGNPKDMQRADMLVRKCDVVLFGGAPLFNYRYQVFYKRTAITVELAQKYGKPVLFSAIGVEGYDEDNDKCQMLKEALNLPCVRQITTRDNLEALEQFKARDDLKIARVADPALFACERFARFADKPAAKSRKRPTVGIFIIRANAFIDNGIDFNRDAAMHMWGELIADLEERGFDYRLLTSGHFGDEAFLDRIITSLGISLGKAVFNVNTPEDLVSNIAQYDAIVSARLHPNIVAYSLGVPAVSISWNPKVDYFYAAIGHPERVVHVDDGGISARTVADAIELAAKEGIKGSPAYAHTVYESLFEGLKGIFKPGEQIAPYTYAETIEAMPPFEGTTEREAKAKLSRKFRRTYGKYNSQSETIRYMEKEPRKHAQTVARLNSNLASSKAALGALASKLANSERTADTLRSQLAKTESDLAKAEGELAASKAEIAKIRGSKSWKLTAPLRKMRRGGK